MTRHLGPEVLLVPHPVFDGAHFSSLEALSSHSEHQVGDAVMQCVIDAVCDMLLFNSHIELPK
jgi:hypothetical protein